MITSTGQRKKPSSATTSWEAMTTELKTPFRLSEGLAGRRGQPRAMGSQAFHQQQLQFQQQRLQQLLPQYYCIASTSSQQEPTTPPLFKLPNLRTTENSEPVCRICRDPAGTEPLSEPCDCRGTSAHVHLSCLALWLGESRNDACEICGAVYRVQRIRRSLQVSIQRWLQRPRQKNMIKEIIMLTALTPLYIWAVECAGSSAETVLEYIPKGSASPIRLWGLLLMVFCEAAEEAFLVCLLRFVRRQGLSPWRWYTWWRADTILVNEHARSEG